MANLIKTMKDLNENAVCTRTHAQALTFEDGAKNLELKLLELHEMRMHSLYAVYHKLIRSKKVTKIIMKPQGQIVQGKLYEQVKSVNINMGMFGGDSIV